MKAILLAAGRGSRLRPITDEIPKCLVTVGGETLLENWLRRLWDSDVSRVLVNLHYLGEKVEKAISSSRFSDFVDVVWEQELLGTAGTVSQNSRFFDGNDGLVIHADNFCTFSISHFLNQHQGRPHEAKVSVVGFRTTEPDQCGIFEVDGRGVMTDYWEKTIEEHGNLANGGIYAVTPDVYRQLTGKFDFARDVLPTLCRKVFVWEQSGPFIDVGTPERLQIARMLAGGEG